jgi:hypothetical protein
MPTLTVPATSTVYIWQQVLATLGGSTYNPTSDAVSMAFQPMPQYGPPANATSWNPATWETDSGSVPVYWAKCLIGPSNGGVLLAPGAYAIQVKITDSPEVPTIWGWTITIT